MKSCCCHEPVSLGKRLLQGESDEEPCFLARCAAHPYLSAQGLGQLTDESKPHTGACSLMVGALEEGFKQAFDVFGLNTDTIVFDADLQLFPVGADAYCDFSPLGSELDGIGNQVAHHLLHGIGDEKSRNGLRSRIETQVDTFQVGHRSEMLDNHLHESRHIALLPGELHGLGSHLGNIEQLVDEGEQRLPVALDHCERLLLVGIFLLFIQKPRQSEDDGERRAKFVGDIGEKGLPCFLQSLGGLLCAASQVVDVSQYGDDGRQEQYSRQGSNGYPVEVATALLVCFLKFIVV